MKQNNEKEPMHDTTKNDSSDVEKVQDKGSTAPPQPQPDASEAGGHTTEREESEEAAKGHS